MKRRTMLLGAIAPAFDILAGHPGVALAQDNYPSRPIRMIVANPAGGPGDLISRAFGEKASSSLGQPFVVENRGGAGTVIGTQAAARSDPDGYTIFNLTTSGVVQTVLQDKLPYDLQQDFVPIVGIGYFPMVITVPSSSSIRSLQDLAAAAKRPAGITYGSGGTGTLAHLAAVGLLSDVGGSGTHVPYRGSAPAMQGLLGGQIDMFFGDTLLAMSMKESLRVLAVTSKDRMAGLPDVPTTSELGMPGLNSKLWFSFLAPTHTPTPIVQRLYTAFAAAKDDQAFRKRLEDTYGFELEIMSASACATYMREEADRWGKVVKANNIRIGD